MAFLRSARRYVSNVFKEYPVTKNMVQVGAIMGCGDIMAQTLAENQKISELDWPRMVKFALLGVVAVAPALHVWYGKMETLLPKDQPHFKRTLKKVAMDQICFAPCFVTTLTASVNLMNGMSMEKTFEEWKQKFIPIMTANYMLWPIVQVVNFGLLPLQYQVVFAQSVALFWNMYLSLKINQKSTT